MSKVRLLGLVLVLLGAAQLSVQCKECSTDTRGCLICADTFYNAQIVCTVMSNGDLCYTDGQCDGELGERCGGGGGDCVVHRVDLRRDSDRMNGEWRLVAVELERPKRSRAL